MNNTSQNANNPPLPMSPFFYRSPATITAQVTSLAILGIIIMLSNLASIITFAKTESLLKRCNYLIINLSVSDFLVAIVAFLAAYYFALEPFHQPVWFITTIEMIDPFTSAVSLMALTMISVERFYAVGFPFRHRMLLFRHYVIMILIPWFIAAVTSLVYILLDFPIAGQKLYFYTISRVSILFLSLVLLILSYIGILIKSFKTRLNNAQNLNRTLRDRKLTITLFIVTLASLLTWLPFQCFQAALVFVKSVTLSHYNYFYVIKFLQYLNSAINFFIYIMRMRDFRRGFLAVFCCKRERNAKQTLSTKQRSLSRVESSRDMTTTSSLSLNSVKQYVNNEEVVGKKLETLNELQL